MCYHTIIRDTYDDRDAGEIWKADRELLTILKEKYEKWYDKAMDIGYGYRLWKLNLYR